MPAYNTGVSKQSGFVRDVVFDIIGGSIEMIVYRLQFLAEIS